MYWCLHNNEVLFSFLGHSDLITDITMNPINDKFLTTSRDKTSRLWDLGKKSCDCIIQESNFATFDDTGKVIASVSYESNEKSMKSQVNFINLYETEWISKGHFKIFKLEEPEIKQLKFTPDGQHLICTTSDNLILVLDAYEGHIIHRLTGEISENDIYLKIDISADSQYVASGTESGNVIIWSINTGKEVTTLECHPQTTNCVKFSPKYSILATACSNMVLWHPSIEQ
jgi:WD40 repeat protein